MLITDNRQDVNNRPTLTVSYQNSTVERDRDCDDRRTQLNHNADGLREMDERKLE